MWFLFDWRKMFLLALFLFWLVNGKRDISVGRVVAPWSEGREFNSPERLLSGTPEQGTTTTTHCSPGAALVAAHCFTGTNTHMCNMARSAHVYQTLFVLASSLSSPTLTATPASTRRPHLLITYMHNSILVESDEFYDFLENPRLWWWW